MKKLFPILVFAMLMAFAPVNAIDNVNKNTAETAVESSTQDDIVEAETAGFHQELKKRFIEGGPGFMGIVLLCLERHHIRQDYLHMLLFPGSSHIKLRKSNLNCEQKYCYPQYHASPLQEYFPLIENSFSKDPLKI